MKDYYGIDAGLVVSIESSEKVKSILLFFAITILENLKMDAAWN